MAAAIQTVDLSAHTLQHTSFSSSSSSSSSTSPVLAQKQEAGEALVKALHEKGFVRISGHGFSFAEIQEAFDWSKALFDLPLAEKLKAPHPKGSLPHRGYSSLGQEKLPDRNRERGSQRIMDYKESYEIGSEEDDCQHNIWLPEEVLPGFRGYTSGLYERFADFAKIVLEAVALGLGLDGEEREELMKLGSRPHCQLRLLHYPTIDKDSVGREVGGRLPAHTDWGSFTMLFQDQHGGLELLDPSSGEYVRAEPEEGTILLNVADMFRRLTNGYFNSALHRVSIPNRDSVHQAGIPSRYSIPFFVGPAPSHTVTSLPRLITAECPARYDPVRFEDYGALVGKSHYRSEDP